LTLQVTSHSRIWNLWAAHFLAAEFVVASLFGVVFWVWEFRLGGLAQTTEALSSTWPELFSTLVTLFGALFGFTITAASIAVALVTDEKMQLFVEGKKYGQLWDTFLQTIASLGFAAAVALFGLILVQVDSTHVPVLCILGFLGILASLRLMRIVWLLDALPRVHAALLKVQK
jgi:hypothetical protein